MNKSKIIEDIKKNYPDIQIVVASKYFEADAIRELNSLGLNVFGESRSNDFLDKYQKLKDLNLVWHFIGTLQTNKVSDIINKIQTLHSLDNLRLASYIQRYRKDVLDVFIQVKIDEDPKKHGIEVNKLDSFLEELEKYSKIKVIGLMTIGSTINPRATFRALADLVKKINKENIKYLSMGMSTDYQIALEEGATHIRLGSIFK